MEPGVVIVDANVWRHLAHSESLTRVIGQCAVAHVQIWPTVVNVLELAKLRTTWKRESLVTALRTVLCGRPLLPWPPKLLQLAGRAALRGRTDFALPRTSLDYLVGDPGILGSQREKMESFIARIEADFRAAHAHVRWEMQSLLRGDGRRDRMPSMKEFIDSQWSTPDNLEHFAGLIWGALRLPGRPPMSVIRRSELWMITLEAWGTAVYDRTMRANQIRRPPGQLDLLQLGYLSASRRSRIFVTDDGALFEAATAVLTGRYPNVRVMRSAQFLGR